MTKVQTLRNSHNIWQGLHDEYGAVSDVRRAHALTAFYTLRKQPDQLMKEHIDNVFEAAARSGLPQATENPTLTEILAVNFAFLHSLGDEWGNYIQAMGERAHTIKTSALFGEISALEKPRPTAPTPTPTPTPLHPKPMAKLQNCLPRQKLSCHYTRTNAMAKRNITTANLCHSKVMRGTLIEELIRFNSLKRTKDYLNNSDGYLASPDPPPKSCLEPPYFIIILDMALP